MKRTKQFSFSMDSADVYSYSEQLVSFGQKIVPFLPYAFAPFGVVYGAYKLLNYLIRTPHKRLELRDKTVLIVGASSGLGRALAFQFYSKGAKLILAARSIDKLEALCDELTQFGEANCIRNGHVPVYRYLDLSELNGDGMAQIRELCTFAIDAKTIDVLVNNAGLSSRGSCSETSMTVYRRLMEVNFFGYVAITRALLDCIPDDGAILNINSIQGRVALPYRSPYSSSKHAIQTGFGSRALDPQGTPMGREDPNQLQGMSPAHAARRIVAELERRNTELVLAPLHIRMAILLRLVAPDLLWHILRRKALAGKEGAHSK